jgi:hypothetical protein
MEEDVPTLRATLNFAQVVRDKDRNKYKTEEEYQSDLEKKMRARGKKLAADPDNPPIDFDELTAAICGTYLLFLARQRKNIEKDSFNGHRSALYHLYRLHGLCYTRQMEAASKACMPGLKRRVARKRQKTGGRVASGKEPVSFELYENMCLWALSL